MRQLNQQKFARALFDEFHSESWTVSEQRAAEIQPERPGYSSYAQAADALGQRDFTVLRNIDKPLTNIDADVLVLLHPCESKWERTTGHSPKLSPAEIDASVAFVEKGGGLLVVTEYAHDKYSDNLNELLAHFGLEIENTTIFDQQACVAGNPAWFFADVAAGNPNLMHCVEKVCFYQAGSCRGGTTALASRSGAGLIGIAQHGKGRVAVITDSQLFGDEHFGDYSHRQLWLNLVYWLGAPAFGVAASLRDAKSEARRTEARLQPAQSPAWASLKGAINALRVLQTPDGTLPADLHDEARHLTQAAAGAIQELSSAFPHERDYLDQVVLDLDAWVAGGFQKPDFAKSLEKFNPQERRRDNIEHLWVMPMYTPNASSDWRFEAIIYRGPWPDWLAELERTQYRNDKLVPGHFVDFTAGYTSECAVLFPETVQVAGKGSNNFATIFCDREAARYQRVVSKAAKITHLDLHPQLECFLNSLPMIQDTYALWDLIHDKSHSVGELPFDPFMLRQRAPFWMYGLEELRVDLRAFGEAVRLAKDGFPFARYVRLAILFDRIYRFPITGSRVRNYDGLG